MDSLPQSLLLPAALWQAIQDHARACLPEEACGLLGGRLEPGGAARVSLALPVENALHSPVRFRMTPEAQLAAFRAIDDDGLELLAIFHSHPLGPRQPSPTDLAEFAYPGVLALILYPQGQGQPPAWGARAFHITGGPLLPGAPAAAFHEVPLQVDAQQ